MPDSFPHMPAVAFRFPSGALSSLAGNIDPHHRIAIADLVLVQRRVRETIQRLMREMDPDLVGLSIMTFQRKTALRIIQILKSLKPEVRIVVGGYDPSLAPEAYSNPAVGVDFIVRREGEVTFRELLRALERGGTFEEIAGLSFRASDQMVENEDRPIARLGANDIHLPNRNARVLTGYTLVGRQVDVVETSRGCTFDCSFCSIVEMRGRNFERYSFERVIADLSDALGHGARSIFFVDDNITLNAPRFEALCHAIVDAGLNKGIDYSVQATTSAIANHGETLAPAMRKAGFRYVFLGIENVLEPELKFLNAESKNRLRQKNALACHSAVKAINLIHRHGMYVSGGFIVGSPGDTRESIEANFEFARRHKIDYPYFQHPMPYPRTPMTKQMRNLGLISHERVEEYDGTVSILKNEHLDAGEIEFLRWRSERWLMMRHMPAVLFHAPWWALLNARKVIAHFLAGVTIKSLLRLEEERAAFERCRALRRAERKYV